MWDIDVGLWEVLQIEVFKLSLVIRAEIWRNVLERVGLGVLFGFEDLKLLLSD